MQRRPMRPSARRASFRQHVCLPRAAIVLIKGVLSVLRPAERETHHVLNVPGVNVRCVVTTVAGEGQLRDQVVPRSLRQHRTDTPAQVARGGEAFEADRLLDERPRLLSTLAPLAVAD